jgi:cytoskeleton protein RodZ
MRSRRSGRCTSAGRLMSEFETAAGAGRAEALPGAPLRLRQAREAAGLHIAALAAALKVPVRKLEALEAGRYDELPDMTFARALASSACRQLRVDPAAVLEQIPGVVHPPLGEARARINAPFKSGDAMGGTGAMGWLARPVVWGAGLLLLAAIAVVLVPQDWVSRFQSATEPSPSSLVSAPEPIVEPFVPPAPDTALPANEQPAAASSEDGTTVPGPAQVPVELPEGAAAPAAPASDAAPAVSAGGLLSIRAVTESWIEVVNGSGEQVVQRVLKPGESLDFSTSPPYSVVVGRADAVQVTVRGQPFDVMPFARNSVARFEVK